MIAQIELLCFAFLRPHTLPSILHLAPQEKGVNCSCAWQSDLSFAEFDLVKDQHEAMDADQYNVDNYYKQKLDEVVLWYKHSPTACSLCCLMSILHISVLEWCSVECCFYIARDPIYAGCRSQSLLFNLIFPDPQFEAQHHQVSGGCLRANVSHPYLSSLHLAVDILPFAARMAGSCSSSCFTKERRQKTFWLARSFRMKSKATRGGMCCLVGSGNQRVAR